MGLSSPTGRRRPQSLARSHRFAIRMASAQALNALQLQVRGLRDLPPLDFVAQKLLGLATRDEVDLGELARTVEMDPGLAARIIGVAGSAFFGYRGTVYTVKDAIVRVLGLDMVKSLALSIALRSRFRLDRVTGFDPLRYWASAMLTAAVAQRLARGVRAPEAPDMDSAFLGGLLHNVGLLALGHMYPAQMAEVLARAAMTPETPLTDVELQIIGADHHQAAGWLACRWHLPSDIVVVLEQHRRADYRGPFWPAALLVGWSARWVDERISPSARPPQGAAELADLQVPREWLEQVDGAFDQQYPALMETAGVLAGRT